MESVAGGAPRGAETLSEAAPQLAALGVGFAGAQLLATRRFGAAYALLGDALEDALVWSKVFDGEAVIADQLPAGREQRQQRHGRGRKRGSAENCPRGRLELARGGVFHFFKPWALLEGDRERRPGRRVPAAPRLLVDGWACAKPEPHAHAQADGAADEGCS